MAGVNKVILIGHLGRDPEMRYTPDGTAVASFSIATSENWTDKRTGEKKESTEWHRIVAWRRLAEICGQYLTKGSQVYIEGKLFTESWEQDGITRYSTKVRAATIQFLRSGNNTTQQNTAGGGYGGRQQHGQPADDEYPPPPMYDGPEDDIPF